MLLYIVTCQNPAEIPYTKSPPGRYADISPMLELKGIMRFAKVV